MPHRHHYLPREALAEPVIVTRLSTVTITPTPTPTTPLVPSTSSHSEQTSVSHPVVKVPVQSSQSTTHSTSYYTPSSSSVPVVPTRHPQRPPKQSSTSHSSSVTPKSTHSPSKQHTSSKATTSSTHHPAKSSHSKVKPTSVSSPKPKVEKPVGAPANRVHENGQSQGMSGGAKAGVAIGLLLVFSLVGALVFLFYRRKKNQNDAHQPLDDEKTDMDHSGGSISSNVSGRGTNVTAPRLSLRPVTEFFPSMSEKHDSKSATSLAVKPKMSPKIVTSEANQEPKINPFEDGDESPSGAQVDSVLAPTAAVPKPLSVKSERTGNGISEGSPVATDRPNVAAAAGTNPRRLSPPSSGTNNVHRVQLDFNPSMDDELGLRAGQLVRMLHEYDDGWALCIRLDRSQQGVVPRTCISKLPVKPRPQGPPSSSRGPQGRARGGAPAARAGGFNDSKQHPVASNNSRARSQSNTQQTSQAQSSGAPSGQAVEQQTRARASSDAVSAQRVTPTEDVTEAEATSPTQGGSVPSRKPVPGQAL